MVRPIGCCTMAGGGVVSRLNNSLPTVCSYEEKNKESPITAKGLPKPPFPPPIPAVALEGARLRAADGDPIINPALRIKLMTDFGIELPSLEEPDATPAEVIGSVREAVRGRPDWKVTERVVLSTFTFHKEAMYRDLLDNAEAVSGHDLVQLMALGAQVWNAERES